MVELQKVVGLVEIPFVVVVVRRGNVNVKMLVCELGIVIIVFCLILLLVENRKKKLSLQIQAR
jgi:hypothetical protein